MTTPDINKLRKRVTSSQRSVNGKPANYSSSGSSGGFSSPSTSFEFAGHAVFWAFLAALNFVLGRSGEIFLPAIISGIAAAVYGAVVAQQDKGGAAFGFGFGGFILAMIIAAGAYYNDSPAYIEGVLSRVW